MHFKQTFGTLFCLLFLHPLFASQNVDFAFFQDKPQSLAKDFYIYEYLQSDRVTPKEATMLFGMVHSMNLRFFHLFAKKMENPEFQKISYCLDLDITRLMKEDDACLNIGINSAKLTSLPKSQFANIKSRLIPQSSLLKLFPIMESENVFESALRSDSETFLSLYNGSITNYKMSHFNQQMIPATFLDKLSLNPKFNQMVYNTVQNDKLGMVQKSLLHVNPSSLHVNAKSLFYLGLNALKYNENSKAIAFFEHSIERAKKQEEKDRALFWQYLASGNASYLQKLSQSSDINIYSLFALETLSLPLKNVVSPHLEGTHPYFDVSEPFAWTEIMQRVYHMSAQETEILAQSFKYANTLPHYSYLMERATRYSKHYYPIPYPEEIADYSTHRQALMLAIARQESRFLPSVVSTSYALGMMQFMPFVARDIAKKEKLEDFNIAAMFNPKVAYLFGNIHLNFLERKLISPLFVAYAYNGGLGFTKRHLEGGAFSSGMYEPFWSMETMINEESREYGKKVLANYVVYRHLLGDDVSIKNLFEKLLIPSASDRFRN